MAVTGKAGESQSTVAHLRYADLYKDSEGVVKVVIADNLFLTSRQAEEIAAAINDFTHRVLHLLLIIPGNNTSIDKGFLLHMASGNTLQYNAMAFVLKNARERDVADSILDSFIPMKPVMFFESEEDAVLWLKTRISGTVPSSTDPNVEYATKESGIKMEEIHHHPDFDMYKRSDGIVIRVSRDYSWLTIKEIKESVAALKEITGGIPHPVLAITGVKSSLDKDARSYAAPEEAMRYTTATAVVIKAGHSALSETSFFPLTNRQSHSNFSGMQKKLLSG